LYRQVAELFERLRDASPPEREAVLGSVAPQVAARIRAMLQADAATGPLDHPSALPGAGGPWRGQIPERIGPYRVIGELGRGSMGVVLEAERDRLGKRAAVKILRLASASETARRRFEHEARILARLRHSGIAQVF